MDRELLDAETMAGHLVPPGSVFAFLAGHRRELFPDSFTADLFPSRTGRPSLPADLVGAARAQARTEQFKRACPTRSAIERIIAWTTTQNGRRIRLRYLGAAKNNAWLHTRCAAINLRTLLRHGLTRRDGAWVLA